MAKKCEKYFEKVKGTCKKTNLGRIQEIKDTHGARKIGKFLIDVQTANAILTVHKALKPKNKEKFKKIINSDVRKASSIAWELV